jgi:hypothetical protein
MSVGKYVAAERQLTFTCLTRKEISAPDIGALVPDGGTHGEASKRITILPDRARRPSGELQMRERLRLADRNKQTSTSRQPFLQHILPRDDEVNCSDLLLAAYQRQVCVYLKLSLTAR